MEGKFVVTYAGALGMANDIATILECADPLRTQCSELNFLIVGDGKERARLEEMARSRQLENVHFLGARPKSEIPALLAASDVCIATLLDIPMFRTTYPNKVFDYMAAGRPTVLAIDGVIREVMEAAGGGIFVEPSNGRAMGNAILKLYRDPELRLRLGKAARTYVETHFNRSEHARSFAALLESMAH